jgi:single-strand DNA-binding protein
MATEQAAGEWANEVRLVGRVSADPDEREMPSGDTVVLFRLVVPRGAAAAGAGGASVDTIDVACWSGRAKTSGRRLRAGDHAEVSGALRRRFFRTGGGPASRYEVDARAVRRTRRGS